MHCPGCTSTTQYGWHYCRWCGAALPITAVAPQIADMWLRDAFLGGLASWSAQAQQVTEQQPTHGGSRDLLGLRLSNMLNDAMTVRYD